MKNKQEDVKPNDWSFLISDGIFETFLKDCVQKSNRNILNPKPQKEKEENNDSDIDNRKRNLWPNMDSVYC